MDIEQIKKDHTEAEKVCDKAYADLAELRERRQGLVDEQVGLEDEKKKLALKLVSGDAAAKKRAGEISIRLATLAPELEPMGQAVDEYLARAQRAQDALAEPARALTREHVRMAARDVTEAAGDVDKAIDGLSSALRKRAEVIIALEEFAGRTKNELFDAQIAEALRNLKASHGTDRAIARAGLTKWLHIQNYVPAAAVASMTITDVHSMRSLL